MCDACTYKLVGTDATTVSELAAVGISLKNKSTDGNLAIIDSHDVAIPTLTSEPSKPSYIVEGIDTSDMTKSEAKTVQAYFATTSGNTNGYSYDRKT